MKKKFRLTKTNDFKKLFDEQRIFYSQNIILKAVKNDLEYSRFGIIVSTKVSKRAVDRNKIKRRIREILRINYNNIKQGIDVLVIAKRAVLDKEYRDIESDVLKGLQFLRAIEKA